MLARKMWRRNYGTEVDATATDMQLTVLSNTMHDGNSVHSSPSESCWEAFVDEESGNCYYFNKDTGETTWKMPAPIQNERCF